MIVSLAYLGRSAVRSEHGGLSVAFQPNLSRQPVAFDAPLRSPLRLREAISALHDVVVSDLRFQPRDKSAYQAWKRERQAELERLRQDVLARERAAIKKTHADLPPDLERRHRDAAKRYWRARDAYGARLRQENYRLWLVLDPVITVAPDVLYFECFSKDESSYGCLTVERDGGFGRDSAARLGTTNVDYSWELYNHFQGLRTYRQTRFSIDPQGFELSVGDQQGYREEKIDLPASWLRGFMQLQGAMGLPMRRVPLTREALYALLAYLKGHRARSSPRAIRFELKDGRPPELVLEPWERRLVSWGTRYSGPDGEPIRIWGRRRLLSLARLLPLCDGVDVYLLGTGFPSFWVVRMGEMRLTLGLSGWTTNDWSRGSALHLLAPPVTPARTTLERIGSTLREAGAAPLAAIARQAGCDEASAAAGLNQLAHSGQVIFDLQPGVYRWRQIMPQALGEAQIGAENPELVESRALFLGGRFEIESREAGPRDGWIVSGRVEGKPASVVVDGDGLIKRGNCVCGHHRRAGIRMGPCRHLLTLRQATGEVRSERVSSAVDWWNQRRRFGG
jgi:hypothetical protein